MEFSLYRCYNTNNDLLYVGASMNQIQRINAHMAHSNWFPLVERINISKYTSKADLLAAEKDAISKEAPMFNTNGRTVERRNSDTAKRLFAYEKLYLRYVFLVRDEIIFMRKMRFSMAEISKELSIDKKRVRQILEKAK